MFLVPTFLPKTIEDLSCKDFKDDSDEIAEKEAQLKSQVRIRPACVHVSCCGCCANVLNSDNVLGHVAHSLSDFAFRSFFSCEVPRGVECLWVCTIGRAKPALLPEAARSSSREA
jgi:hypothetical protein